MAREPRSEPSVFASPAATGGEPLAQRIGTPWELLSFLEIAQRLATALAALHERGIVHQDIRPDNVLTNAASGELWLIGLTASTSEPVLAKRAALPYMAPEQTGRMDRHVDARSDLYSLGVVLYELLTGVLPFQARDALEWIHSHVAKRHVAPDERVPGTPSVVSALVMKLLAKDPDERYQSARSVAADLQQCLLALRERGRIDSFELGASERRARLHFPGKLYGRERELAALHAAFARVQGSGASELVLVSGHSGIGKSALVHALQASLSPAQALFASGKFDQFKRDIPYATFAHALQDVVRGMLSESEDALAHWRAALRQALGANGQLLVSLVPELELVVGEQAPLAELPPRERKARFQQVFCRFIGALARPEQPLLLFLDDLQWLDAATLELLEHLATQPEVRHVLVLGAFRSHEVDGDHALTRAFSRMLQAGVRMEQIALAPLPCEGVCAVVADVLSTPPTEARPLADLIYEKTGGNAFFVTQLVTELHDSGLVTASASAARPLRWDRLRIEARGSSENIVALMVERLDRLPEATRALLVLLAGVGQRASVDLLCSLAEADATQVHAGMAAAVRAGLVLRLEGGYSFLHDRVQEASYALVAPADRPALHCKIGRVLADQCSDDAALFDVVNQINRGLSQVDSAVERVRFATLNLRAGKLAKRATAYAAAQSYLEAGASLAPADDALRFELDFQLAECELLLSELTTSDARLARLAERAQGPAERAAVACLRLDLFTVMDRSDLSVEVGLAYLAQAGIDWPRHPSDAEVTREYDRLFAQLGTRPVEALAELPALVDADVRAMMDVLTKLQVPALFYDENLQGMVIGRMANLSLEHGNSDGSVFAYCWLGAFLASHFGMYDRALRFADLSIQLVARPELSRFKARVLCVYGYLVNPWVHHLRSGVACLQSANASAREIGDLTFVAYTSNHLVTLGLALGRPLADVQREAESGLALASNARFGLVEHFFAGQLALIRALRGLPPALDAAAVEQRFAREPALAIAACWYWIRKLQSRLFAADPRGALDAAACAQPLLWTSTSSFEIAEYHFYVALAHAGAHDLSPHADHVHALRTHLATLAHCAERCPANFGYRVALVQAELARVLGDELAAEGGYERALTAAQEQGFTNGAGLAAELAWRFHARRGLATIARGYLDEARRCYQRWGAADKLRQLEESGARLAHADVSELGASLTQLDAQAVIQASLALSSEIMLDRLVETLLRMTVEHAGAERGLLLAWHGDKLQLEASAKTEDAGVVVLAQRSAANPSELPLSLVHHAARTQENVILGDAMGGHRFAADPYFAHATRRSIACLPLVKQARVVGVLYLENNLTSHAFTPALTAVLRLLASQAAVSLENARLYRETDSRLAFSTMRSQIASSFASSTPERLAESIGEALARVAGFFAIDAIALVWLAHSDAAARARHYFSRPGSPCIAEALSAAALPAVLRGEDVSIADVAQLATERPQLAAAHVRALFAWPLVSDGNTVATIIFGFCAPTDFSRETLQHMKQLAEVFLNTLARQQTLSELGRSEAALQQAQLELTHASRLAALGELAASIAHEVNQPLAAIVADAGAGLNWLSRTPPELAATRESLEAICRDGKRAGDVINRIRALVRSAPARREACDIAAIIEGVVPLLHGQLQRAGIALDTVLAKSLPMVEGDAVELQQVVLNLVLNASDATRDVSVERRRVTIRAELQRLADEQCVVVAVRDLGVGLPSTDASRLFDAFYTTKSGGLGLGLPISRSIVSRHGGRLWAEAAAPGALFCFALPVL
jgi:predicted ATPase/signal transduction histidine kinase